MLYRREIISSGKLVMVEFDIVAIVVSIVSAIVSIVSIYLNRKNNIELAKIKNDFEIKKDEQAAIRNYEYNARQRLYQEFEPLLFLLVEHSESAYRRIYELSRSAKSGNLEPDQGWLSVNEYFMISTIHRLLLPLAVFSLMQRKLTIFDLDLVPYYKAQYLLSKCLYFSFSDDYSLANTEPSIEYDPDNHPKIYRKQGIYRGVIDNLVGNLIVSEPSGTTRLKSFGEFEKEYLRSSMEQPYIVISDLFHNFHPRAMPILWRIFIAQAHIYNAIRFAREKKYLKSETNFKTLKTMSGPERQLFDWRSNPQEADDNEVFDKTFRAVELYLRDRLSDFIEQI
jgi:hypothetical protein